MKKKSVLFTLAACLFAMLMLTGCLSTEVQDNAATGEKTSNTYYAESPHMTVESISDGFKITVRNMDGGNIAVYEGEKKVPATIDLHTDRISEYLFQLTEANKQYTIELSGFSRDAGGIHELVTCTAQGGYFNSIDLYPVLQSVLEGEVIDDNRSHVKLSSTGIRNPGDIIKNSDDIENFHFALIFVLGDNDSMHQEDWYAAYDIYANEIKNWMNGELGKKLTEYSEIRNDNWERDALTDSIKEKWNYTYKFYIRACFRMKDGSHDYEYQTDPISTPLYFFDKP